MLKKEHVKQAIEAIAARDAEIGYTLDEMLSTDRIHPIAPDAGAASGGDYYFIFNDRPVAVRKFLFFNQGTVPIQERLLIKYGEMRMQHQISQSGDNLNYKAVAGAIREAGLRLLVNMEIDLALQQLQGAVDAHGLDPAWASGRRSRLEAIKQDREPLALASGTEKSAGNVFYSGTVDQGLPACFIQLPFCMAALMQAADINLEFFNIRFLLTCWIKGLERNLFACVVDSQIEGLVYLAFKKSYFYSAVEIHYVATAAGRPATDVNPGRRQRKGVGTFLTAGVWLLWKNQLAGMKDLLLDSEIGARHFYEGVGFQSRGFSGFIMKQPRGRLVRAILEMAGRCPDLPERPAREIVRLLQEQLSGLRKKPRAEKDVQARKNALESVKTFLQTDGNPAINRMVREQLVRYRRKIPEADVLIACPHESQ